MALRSKNIVELIISAKDGVTKTITAINKALFNLKTGAVAAGAALASALGLNSVASLFKSATNSAADFEQQMAKVAAVTNASAEDFEALKKAAEGAGATTKFTATESAQALEVLARSGLSATQAIEALPQVLSLAAAEGLELAESSGFITKTLAQFGLAVNESSRVIDVLVKTSQSANTNVREVGNALSYAGLLAKDADVSLEETAAIIGKLADAGIAGERAGTALRSILSQLADPASKARKELEQLGDTSGDLTTALDTIRAAGQRGNAALLAFGTEAAPALRALVNVGKPALDQLTESLQNAQGTADKAAATMGGTLQGALTRLGSAWDALKRTVVQPLLKPIADDVNQLAVAIGDFVQSGRLTALQQSLLQTFKESSAAAKAFFQNFDFDKFSADLGNFVRETTQSFSTLTSVVSTGANVLTVAFGGLKSVVAASRIAIGQIKGDTDAVDAAFNDLAQSSQSARDAMQRLGLISEDVKDVIEAVSRETYDAAAAQERLNSTAYETADSLKKITPAATDASAAVSQLGIQANDAAGAVDELNQSASVTGSTVEKSIGGITAAFDGSVESIKAVSEQLRVQQEATDRVAKSTEQAADAEGKRGARIKLASDHLQEMAARADNAKQILSEAGQSGSDDFQQLNNELELLKANLEVINDFGRSPRDFRANFDYGFGELLRNAERAKTLLGDMDTLMQKFGEDTASAGELSQALARANALARNEAQLLGEERLRTLRDAIADAQNRMQALGDQANETRDRIAELDAELAEAQGNDARAKQLRLELEFAEKLAEVEARIAEARLVNDRENIALLEEERRKLEQLLELRQKAIEDNARVEQQTRTPTPSAPQPSSGSGSGSSIVVNISSNIFDNRTLNDVARQLEKELKRIGALKN